MNINDAILKRRTIRRFQQRPIDRRVLIKLIDAARIAPSASNMQPLKYIIVDDKEVVDAIFDQVKWAAYIAPDGTPVDDERPTAFIAVLIDTSIKTGNCELDIGAACQNVFLSAIAEEIGTCWMGAINRNEIKKILNIPERYILNTVIALGYAAENPVIEDTKDSINYYKDSDGVLHVPKRKLEDIIIAYNNINTT